MALLVALIPVYTLAAEINYSQMAKDARWTFDESRAGVCGTIIGWASKYDISLLYYHESDSIEIGVLFGRRKIYSWLGSTRSVFRIVGDKLYYIDIRPGGAGGGNVVAVNLLDGKVLWQSKLVAFNTEPPVQHSFAVLLMNVDANATTVRIWGEGAGGRFYEIKSAKTGETLGHKIFRSGNGRGQ